MYKDENDWEETQLFREIVRRMRKDDPPCDSAAQLLKLSIPDIQAVLQQGGTASTDFTLHDAGHGYRVAERMTEIVGDMLEKLSGYELALLLMSAYLHDIGMTPQKKRITGLYNFLLTEETGDLSATEIDTFRQWLDRHGDYARPPMAKESVCGKTLGDAGWLVAHYCRARHNDWGADWMRGNLNGKRLGEYRGWIDDLITLCKSHHEGFEQLASRRFDPIPLGDTVVHLRYLAAVLRLADVMEIDPERTPEVILRQRDVDPSSLIFWEKDHHISLVREKGQYRLFARPPSALIHKAVLDTARQIEDELLLCRRLADETDFGFLPGSRTRLPHDWFISGTLGSMRIDPLNDAYEYIDGTFRPDVQRLLKLLSGVELYGNELAAVRELLQNAFDAVRERIARERLTNPGDLDRADLLGRLYKVRLDLEQQGNDYWLVCHDEGAGMTKTIIRDHLLVSGSTRRDDLLRLQRRCEAAGFRLERTAKFGIGVLSYFMIADEVRIHTRRCPASGDAEDTGWSFVTDGINGFGELRRDPGWTAGSEVRLRIRSALLGKSPGHFWKELVEYVREILLETPCPLHVSSEAFPEFHWHVDAPGRVRPPGAYAEQSLSVLISETSSPTRYTNLADHLDDLVPVRRHATWQDAKDKDQTRHDAAHRALRWSDIATGELPDGLGRWRFYFPWFALDGGACLDFFDSEEIDGATVAKLGSSQHAMWVPWCPVTLSWFGIRSEHRLEWLKEFRCPGVVEIDWTSEDAGKIEVSRNRLILSQRAEEAIKTVITALQDARRTFAEGQSDSRFALYNCSRTQGDPPAPEAWWWLCQHPQARRLEWRQLNFPAVAPIGSDPTGIMQTSGYRWSGQTMGRYCGVDGSTVPAGFNSELNGVSGYAIRAAWYSRKLPPDRVVQIVDRFQTLFGLSENRRIGMLWERAPMLREPRLNHPECRFPPEWASLCMIGDPPQVLWNLDHPLVRATSGQAWRILMDSPCHGGDPRPFAKDLLSASELAAAWLLFCLSIGARDLVQGVAEHSPELLAGIWTRALGSDGLDKVWAKIDDVHGHRLVAIHARGWDDVESTEMNAEHFSDPSSEWRVYSMRREDAAG